MAEATGGVGGVISGQVGTQPAHTAGIELDKIVGFHDATQFCNAHLILAVQGL